MLWSITIAEGHCFRLVVNEYEIGILKRLLCYFMTWKHCQLPLQFCFHLREHRLGCADENDLRVNAMLSL